MAITVVNLNDTFRTLVQKTNTISADVGDLATLTTTVDSAGLGGVVGAINEHDTEIGDVSSLTTTATNLSSAINELDSDVGVISTLGTTDKSNLVAAINEINTQTSTNTSNIATNTSNISTNTTGISNLDSDVGVRTSLTTTDNTTLVAAINENRSRIIELYDATGTLLNP